MPRMLRSLCRAAGRLLDNRRGRIVTLAPSVEPRGHMLLSYLTRPFLGGGGSDADPHTNVWECRQLAQTFLDLGFAVDVIDWNNERFLPRRPYRFLVDIGAHLERLAPLVGPNCTKILHATGKHWLFQNRAEYERLAALLARRGIALQPRRIAPAGLGVESADCLTVLGNQATIDTLAYAGKPCFPIPLSTTAEFAWDDTKDFNAVRRRFVWFGSSGMVHKGLDLVLEAFAAAPELQLTVCGPVEREPDFAAFYRRELYETPNIRTVGWVNVAGREFGEIVRTSAALVYPSCSEGCAGCVVTSLHAGLIPLISPRERRRCRRIRHDSGPRDRRRRARLRARSEPSPGRRTPAPQPRRLGICSRKPHPGPIRGRVPRRDR